MGRQVTLEQVETALDELSYPVMRTDAAREFEDTTLQFPDGEENLGKLLSETHSDSFDSVAEVETELREVLPGEVAAESVGTDVDG
ncbi:DUF5789 family protein [Halostella salina]|uniref:DUF5789 family protein n=1 Tax=Halostella salina TaxID=1547897 RepID=UPI000EF77819|nr:hypothetical protein [Halostella salina]